MYIIYYIVLYYMYGLIKRIAMVVINVNNMDSRKDTRGTKALQMVSNPSAHLRWKNSNLCVDL